MGHFVYLACTDVTARDVFELHFDDLVTMLERKDDLFASVSRERIEYVYASGTWS